MRIRIHLSGDHEFEEASIDVEEQVLFRSADSDTAKVVRMLLWRAGLKVLRAYDAVDPPIVLREEP